jgi:hypothetical protein
MMKPLPGYPQSQVRKATLVAVLTDMVAVVDDRQAEVNMIRWTYNVILVKDDRRDTLFNVGMEIIRGRGDNQQAAWQDDERYYADMIAHARAFAAQQGAWWQAIEEADEVYM